MEEFRVPTVEVEAEVICADGRTLSGVFFMPALSAVQGGAMRPEEWINGGQPFFPFRAADPHASLLLNKAQVLALIVAVEPVDGDASEEAEGRPAWEADVPVRRLVVDAGERRFEGFAVIDMPANQQRVVDYLNRADRFLPLRGEERLYLIRKERIARVIEVGRV